MNKKAISMLLLTTILGTIVVGMPVANAVGGTLALCPATVSWDTTTAPGSAGNRPFTLQVNVTDVQDLYGFALISVHWDTSLFDLLSCVVDGTCMLGTPGSPLPLGTGGTSFMGPPANIKEADGNMTGTAYTELSPFVTFNLTAPTWAKVLILNFKYTGADPSIGSPVDSDIILVDEQWLHAGGYKMGTKWAKDGVAQPQIFSVLGPCHFHFEAVALPLRKPTASFHVEAPATPPYYVCENMTFDAHLSTGGCDGDTDPTPITELHWSYGDTSSEVYIQGVNFTWYPKHHYLTTGDMDVSLYVVAPKVGWADPGYQNTSDTVHLTVKISPKLATYIDVYTENERWPPHSPGYYITIYNGTGPGVDAEAYSPQENVTLYAIVVWKGDVVQNKLVKFYIEGPANPYGQIWLYRTAYTGNTTGTYGIATVTFRIPWPCEHAEARIFGTWTVTATVSLAEFELQDTLTFKVGWIVEIIKVELVDSLGNPKTTFKKGECIGIKLTVKNIAKEIRYAELRIVVYDDAGAVIGRAAVNTWVPADTTQTYMTEWWCALGIPKWAFVGERAMVYADAYTPMVPWCPEQSAGPFTIEKAP